MIKIYRTDKHIGRGIYVAQSALFPKKRRQRTLEVCSLINQSLDIFYELLSLPQDLVIRVAPLGVGRYGRYNQEGLMEINSNLTPAKTLTTLAHELVHGEQYHQKRLSQRHLQSKGWVHHWHGTPITNKGTTYKAYRQQPWEQEAFQRQGPLAREVKKRMNTKYDTHEQNPK